MEKFRTFGNPLPFPLNIHDDWVRIQCGVDGTPNYIFGMDGLNDFYLAGAGIYSRKNGRPKDSLEYWITWYEKEKTERIKVNSLIGDVKSLLHKIYAK